MLQVRLQPTITQNVVNYTVIVDVPNPDLKLLPGMTANITVLVQEEKDILKVPATALRFSPPQEYIDAMLKNIPDSIRIKRERWNKEGGRGGQGNMQGGVPGGMRGQGGGPERRNRSSVGMIWIKVGDSIKSHRVHLGISDGLNTEVSGKISEGQEVVISMTNPQSTTASQQPQQQQNPFSPQMPRGGGRGGR